MREGTFCAVVGNTGNRTSTRVRLIADGVVSERDPRRPFEVLAEIQRMVARGQSVVAVLDDFNTIAHFADRVIVMHRGAIAAVGSPEEILHPTLLSRILTLPCAAKPYASSGTRSG